MSLVLVGDCSGIFSRPWTTVITVIGHQVRMKMTERKSTSEREASAAIPGAGHAHLLGGRKESGAGAQPDDTDESAARDVTGAWGTAGDPRTAGSGPVPEKEGGLVPVPRSSGGIGPGLRPGRGSLVASLPCTTGSPLVPPSPPPVSRACIGPQAVHVVQTPSPPLRTGISGP